VSGLSLPVAQGLAVRVRIFGRAIARFGAAAFILVRPFEFEGRRRPWQETY
jgi:hypothetical protein